MPDTPHPFTNACTKLAHTAILAAAHAEQDFAEWLAGVLTDVAAELDSTPTLIARRLWPWEATPDQGVRGTIAYDDELLQHGEHIS